MPGMFTRDTAVSDRSLSWRTLKTSKCKRKTGGLRLGEMMGVCLRESRGRERKAEGQQHVLRA